MIIKGHWFFKEPSLSDQMYLRMCCYWARAIVTSKDFTCFNPCSTSIVENSWNNRHLKSWGYLQKSAYMCTLVTDSHLKSNFSARIKNLTFPLLFQENFTTTQQKYYWKSLDSKGKVLVFIKISLYSKGFHFPSSACPVQILLAP